jgi:hypothetical protein
MKYLQLLFLVMLLNSCSVEKMEGLEGLTPAAIEVNEMIAYTEKQLKKHDRGKLADFYKIRALVALSKITPKEIHGDYLGVHYIPTRHDIILWKEWYDKNKYYFSYDPISERYKDLLHNGKIIVLKLPNGSITKSISEEEIENLESIYQYVIDVKKENEK